MVSDIYVELFSKSKIYHFGKKEYIMFKRDINIVISLLFIQNDVRMLILYINMYISH